MSHVRGQYAERDGEVRLADAWRTKEDDIAALVQETPGRQLIEDALVERWLLMELEVGEMLLIGQVGELEVETYRLLVAETHLGIEQITEEVGIRPARGSGLVELLLRDPPDPVAVMRRWPFAHRGCSSGNLLISHKRSSRYLAIEGELPAWRRRSVVQRELPESLDMRWIGDRVARLLCQTMFGHDHVLDADDDPVLAMPISTLWPAYSGGRE